MHWGCGNDDDHDDEDDDDDDDGFRAQCLGFRVLCRYREAQVVIRECPIVS